MHKELQQLSELDRNKYVPPKKLNSISIKIKNVVFCIYPVILYGKKPTIYLNVYLCTTLLSMEKYQVQYILGYKWVT